ncbi:MAG: Cyclin-L1, partial [Marteilia pararefringens]
QEASATAQIIFQRFFYQRSIVTNDYLQTAIACISIASKVEEYFRSLREIIVVFNLVYKSAKNK